MTEFEKADLNNNGVIEKAEWNKLALEDRRLEMIDRDLKRNAERRFTGFALAGMLIYPFIILLASVLGFDKAATLITDIASVYVIAASGVVAILWDLMRIVQRLKARRLALRWRKNNATITNRADSQSSGKLARCKVTGTSCQCKVKTYRGRS